MLKLGITVTLSHPVVVRIKLEERINVLLNLISAQVSPTQGSFPDIYYWASFLFYMLKYNLTLFFKGHSSQFFYAFMGRVIFH